MWYWFFSATFWVVLRFFYRIKVEGSNNIPRKTNFIIVSNHFSFLDPILIMSNLPFKIHCIAMRCLYRIWWLRWFLNAIEAIPGGSASQKSVDLLMQNKNVGLFPEGGVSADGKLKEFRRGAALLALKTGRPILPCAVLGAYEALPLGCRNPRIFRTIKIKISQPVYLLKEFDEIIDDIYMQEGLSRVRNKIKEMLDAG